MLKDFTNIKFDIIIAAGQSNCEGSGVGDVECPYIPKENVWSMNRNFTISTSCEKVQNNVVLGAFPLKFADEYIENGYLKSDRQILIIESAVSGTGFTEGNHKETWHRGGELSQTMFDMVKTAMELNCENKVVAFVWHQGENSVNYNVTKAQHYAYMKELLSDVTQKIAGEYPIITGDFVQAWIKEQSGKADEITQANREITAEFNGYFVQTEKLTSNAEVVDKNHIKFDDTIHFSRNALYELGERYFEKFVLFKSAK